MGNPTTYRGKALEWSHGRRLTKYGNVTFEYDAAGMRTRKNDTTYVLDGNRILRETTGTQTISYYYGMDGVIGFRYGNSDYYYRKNLLGDVIGIYCNGVCVAQYNYDAWGKVLSVNNLTADNIGTLNPFRYRSYYYDVETGLYYLETRYYDPEVGRFLNSDSVEYLDPETLGGLNLYAYCNNNPVMNTDPSGNSILLTLGIMAIGALIGAAVGATSSIVTQQIMTGEVNWKSVGVAAVSGFVGGAVAASPLGLVGQSVAGGIIGGLSYAADSYVNNVDMSIEGALLSVGMGAVSGLIGGSGANHNMALTNAVTSTKNTIIRESRRANQAYAQKVITKAIGSRNSALGYSMLVGSVRFIIGTDLSNKVNTKFALM